MTTKQRVPLATGRAVAKDLLARLSPHTARMEIAGSVRREREDVGDVELLYIPRLTPAGQGSLLGDSTGVVDLLDVELRRLLPAVASAKKGVASLFTKRLGVGGRPIGYGPLNKALVHQPSGMGIDIFRTTAANWGMAMVVRTGPAEWNVAMMAAFQRLGMKGHAYGGVTVGGEEIRCPTEENVFELLGMKYVSPQQRAVTVGLLDAIGRRTDPP